MKRLTSRSRIVMAVGVVVALLLSGCGSRLSDTEVLAQNATSAAPLAEVSGPAGSGFAPADAAAAVAAGSATAPAPAAGAGTSSGTTTGRVNAPRTNAGAGPAAGRPGTKAVAIDGPATGSVVNVGQIGLFGGFFGELVGTLKVGTAVAVAYINAHGGLNGHRINLIQADDGGDPSTGLALVKKMVEQDKVIAFLNNLNPLSSASIFPAIEKYGIPIIGGLGAEPEYYTRPLSFPGASSPRVQSDAAVKYGIDQGHTKVGIIYCAEFASLCEANAKHVNVDAPQIGGDVVFSQQVSLAQPDYTSQCLAAKSAGVTNLLLVLDPASVVRLADSCANQNYRPYLGMLGFVFGDILLRTKNTEGLVGAGSAFPFPFRTPATEAFHQQFQETVGRAPGAGAEANAWVGGLILQEGGRDLPANPTPADLVRGLTKIKKNNFGGLASAAMTYGEGQAHPSPTCAFMVKVVNGGYEAPNGLKPTCLPESFSGA